MSAENSEFPDFLAGVASRLRHDLKGGLISLRMGLESMESEDELKPLLVERIRELEGLADKMVTLLRMGSLERHPTRILAVLADWKNRVAERWPTLEVVVSGNISEVRPMIDADALVLALCELSENSHRAGARRVLVQLESSVNDLLLLSIEDDGQGFEPTANVSTDDLTNHWCLLGRSSWGRSGIGLSIVERCALAHGGEFRLAHHSDRGVQVTLRLSRGQT